ncbi:MAG: sigma-54-dependent Fis family transcriptional regulator [Acidobacteria bacterium]|nr:sigma-54-dependent Fis family transcriptional regulator [Acidobacteriota bacterium]
MRQTVPPTVLVVEDDADLRQIITDSLEARGFAVAQALTAADAHSRLEAFAYDGMVIDLGLPDADGLDVLDEALTRYPQMRCVVVTGWGGAPEAVRAIKRGAIDFMIKPFQLVQLAQVLEAGINERRLQAENAALHARLGDRLSVSGIIGRSAAMQQVFSALELVSPMKSTVLVQGESGTGKELIARTIHKNSPRRDQPFVAFNAAAVPEGLVEAELFGHARGAFTGAVNARVGRFELADKGTLFIDEVSSMSLALQAKLLRALQEREIERVGESKPFKFDIRLIAATNVDLRAMVKEGTFREDLFYRLNVVPIPLPPLRHRREDIALLVQHFVEKSCRNNGLPLRTVSQAALRVLMDYSWPGNIRQLENAIEYAVAVSGAEREILPSMLPEDIRNPEQVSAIGPVTIPEEGVDFQSVMSQIERDLILGGLRKTGGNKRQAARLLNLSRTTLIDKLHRISGSMSAA